MKEKIKDTIVDLLLDGVKEKLDSVKENYKWQKLFVSTGDFFVNNPDVLVKFEDDLYSVFSKDSIFSPQLIIDALDMVVKCPFTDIQFLRYFMLCFPCSNRLNNFRFTICQGI